LVKNIMSFVAAVTALSSPFTLLADLLPLLLLLALVISGALFFRPLLAGLVRALVLTLRPRSPRVR
jgi:hypothetical protein